jgi:hypothetical protein
LAVEQGNERYYIDSYGAVTLPDGLINANERAMLIFDTRRNTWRSSDILGMWLPTEQLISLFALPPDDVIYDLQWHPVDRYQYTVCRLEALYGMDDSLIERFFTCSTIGAAFNGAYRTYLGGYNPVRQPELGIYATLLDDFTLSTPNFTRDYANVLDSPIMQIEWLPSLFYHDDHG